MDPRSRSLALVVFGLFAAALAWGGYALRQAADRAQCELAQSLPSGSPGSADRESLSRTRTEPFHNPRQELLRVQVDRLSARLNRLSQMLEQKSADYETLKAELNRSTTLLDELLPLAGNDSEQIESSTTGDTEEKVARPEEELSPALPAQLRAAQEKLSGLEKQAALDELRIFELEDGKRTMESAASAALVRSGAAAAAPLTDLLSHRRPQVRRWAATLLGEIGPDAFSAIDALHEALSDIDEEVRIAARKALRKIENP